uniref:Uncharacterized protein n=1 Tax=Arundo donax TaxID=35708 RepID=A0A0A9ADF2_ARUDO
MVLFQKSLMHLLQLTAYLIPELSILEFSSPLVQRINHIHESALI